MQLRRMRCHRLTRRAFFEGLATQSWDFITTGIEVWNSIIHTLLKKEVYLKVLYSGIFFSPFPGPARRLKWRKGPKSHWDEARGRVLDFARDYVLLLALPSFLDPNEDLHFIEVISLAINAPRKNASTLLRIKGILGFQSTFSLALHMETEVIWCRFGAESAFRRLWGLRHGNRRSLHLLPACPFLARESQRDGLGINELQLYILDLVTDWQIWNDLKFVCWEPTDFRRTGSVLHLLERPGSTWRRWHFH